MSTPTPADPAQAQINWYRGPVSWDRDPAKLWHAGCPDPYATGHDGEVWLDHEGGAFCTGCRHFEPGQAEVAAEPAPPLDLAAAEQLVNATGAPPLLAPDEPSAPVAEAPVAAEEPSGSTNAPADEAPESTPDAAVEGEAASGVEQAPAPNTPPEPAPAQQMAAEPTHEGFFGRIVDDLTGHGTA